MTWLKYIFLFVLMSCVSAGKDNRPTNLPCKVEDAKCITEFVQWLIETNAKGIPELGIENTDSVKHEIITGDLGFIKYNLSNSQLEGLSHCKADEAKMFSNLTSMTLDLYCPASRFTGDYDVDGTLFGTLIKGLGKFIIGIANFNSVYKLDLHYYKIGNILYHKHKKFTYAGEFSGDITIELKNSDGTTKQLSEAAQNVLKFAKENSKLFVNTAGKPVLEINTKNFLKNINKRLQHIPTHDWLQINEQLVKIEDA